MYYNRFDIAEAYYIHLQETHTGQGSKEYARLSKLAQKYKPALQTSGQGLLSTENAMEIYLNLQHKYNAKR